MPVELGAAHQPWSAPPCPLVASRPVEGSSRERGIVFQKYSLFPHLTVIVADKAVPGKHHKPNDYRYTQEFADLLEKVRRDGLDPNARQRVEDFDLSHRDAWKPRR